jgi:hypothetical protein
MQGKVGSARSPSISLPFKNPSELKLASKLPISSPQRNLAIFVCGVKPIQAGFCSWFSAKIATRYADDSRERWAPPFPLRLL